MNSKLGGGGLTLVAVLGTLPQIEVWPKDLSALASMVLWVLLGLLVVKVLALFGGAS